jgi:hypothetical protein
VCVLQSLQQGQVIGHGSKRPLPRARAALKQKRLALIDEGALVMKSPSEFIATIGHLTF